MIHESWGTNDFLRLYFRIRFPSSVFFDHLLSFPDFLAILTDTFGYRLFGAHIANSGIMTFQVSH